MGGGSSRHDAPPLARGIKPDRGDGQRLVPHDGDAGLQGQEPTRLHGQGMIVPNPRELSVHQLGFLCKPGRELDALPAPGLSDWGLEDAGGENSALAVNARLQVVRQRQNPGFCWLPFPLSSSPVRLSASWG
jgi:hypothetical protein